LFTCKAANGRARYLSRNPFAPPKARDNDQGWMIYRDPRTGRWHTQKELAARSDVITRIKPNFSADALEIGDL